MTARILFSTRADGDFHVEHVPTRTLDARRRALVDLPWTQPDEVHGTRVLDVAVPGQHDLAEADAVVTGCRGAVLGVWVGDCAPVALLGDDGSIGAVHAGWRGAEAGVLAAAVAALRARGAERVDAVLGPCIHPCCYEFGEDDLTRLTARFGAGVASTTSTGTPALDMRALVREALAAVGVGLDDRSTCTGCTQGPDGDPLYFSHRVRQEAGRQIMAVWRP